MVPAALAALCPLRRVHRRTRKDGRDERVRAPMADRVMTRCAHVRCGWPSSPVGTRSAGLRSRPRPPRATTTTSRACDGPSVAGTWDPVIPAPVGTWTQYESVVVYGTDGPDDRCLGGATPPARRQPPRAPTDQQGPDHPRPRRRRRHLRRQPQQGLPCGWHRATTDLRKQRPGHPRWADQATTSGATTLTMTSTARRRDTCNGGKGTTRTVNGEPGEAVLGQSCVTAQSPQWWTV